MFLHNHQQQLRVKHSKQETERSNNHAKVAERTADAFTQVAEGTANAITKVAEMTANAFTKVVEDTAANLVKIVQNNSQENAKQTEQFHSLPLASDKKFSPVQESDYEGIDSGRQESKPSSFKRRDQQGGRSTDSESTPSRGAFPSLVPISLLNEMMKTHAKALQETERSNNLAKVVERTADAFTQ